MNKVILLGNLTKDPELNTTNSGLSVCKFNLAVQRSFQNAAGEREADFIPVVVWRAQAESCAKYLKKGSKACISGCLQVRSYEDKEGARRYATEVVADHVEFVSTGKKSTEDSAEPKSEPTKPKEKVTKMTPVDDDDLPF